MRKVPEPTEPTAKEPKKTNAMPKPTRPFKEFYDEAHPPLPQKKIANIFSLAQNEPDTEEKTKEEKIVEAPLPPELKPLVPDSSKAPEVHQISGVSTKAEVFAICQTMITKITEIVDRGITTTTVTLGESANRFKGCQIIIEQYDTHPHSFNIDLVGDPQSVSEFEKNLFFLQATLEKQFPKFEFARITTHIKQQETFQKKIESFPLKSKRVRSPLKTKKL